MSRGLLASLVVHSVVVTALLTTLPSSEMLPALFVDLTAANPGAEQAGPAPARPAAVRGRARRQPEAPARMPSSSARPAVPEAPALPEASPPPLSPPVTASPEPGTEAVSSVPALPVPSVAEPESPSASAALSEEGAHAAAPERASAHPGGGSASSDAPGPEHAASHRGGAAAPEEGSRAAGGGVGAGTELARRPPGSEVGEAQALYTEYLARLRQRIHAALRYPPMARRRGLTGAVTIELTILPSGTIRNVAIVQSSQHRLLDEAAVETVRELADHPFPAGVPPRSLRVRLPVVFELQ